MKKFQFRLKNIHFIGIGGSGMNGIAEVLFNIGYCISGSDIESNNNTYRLEKLGIKVFHQHCYNNLDNIDAVVISSAIAADNIEIMGAKERKIPIVSRASMLAEIMRFRFGIAISGTHGKTTATSMISHIMTYAKLDPTYIIGGVLNTDGVSNRLGKSDYLVVEADESDGSFLRLNPNLCVITNIDKDHMQTYEFSEEKLQHAFIKFSENLPFYGVCVACADDSGVQHIISKIPRKVLSYGIDNTANLMAKNINYHQHGSTFDVVYQHHNFNITLNLIGKHNILNCLAAIGICVELGIDYQVIADSLHTFSGAKRRLDFKGKIKINNKNISIFDDYGHHPSEIKAVVKSMQKTFKNNRIIVVFQPHRYSRTKDLFDEFATELAKIEMLILLPIYSANEKTIAGISSSSLANNIRSRSICETFVASNFSECENILLNLIQDDDIILTLGAGDVYKIADDLVKNYAN